MPEPRLLLLGPPRLQIEHRTIELASAKTLALIGYLAVAGPQKRDRVIALLWPDSLPDAARKNLRNLLWQLRKELSHDLIISDSERLELAPGLWVDTSAFVESTRPEASPAELQTALALYRGPLLDSIALADASEFELWLTTEQARWGQRYMRALETLIAHHRDAADWPAVARAAEQALTHDPLNEPVRRALIEAHARQGDRAEALRQYKTLHDLLAIELGVEPLPETEALRNAILSGDLPAKGFAPSASALPRAPRTPGSRSGNASPFIGREHERALLNDALQRARAESARIVLLTGELGIGKTSLWEAWAADLPADAIVLETRALEATRTLPFAPLINLFTGNAALQTLLHPPSPVSAVWLVELARLLPQIRQSWPRMDAAPELPAEEERSRLFEALTCTLRALPTRPIVLFLDDLHWADRTTLDWLGFFIERVQHESLLVIIAYRPDEAPAELIHLVASWLRSESAQRLTLPRFALDEAANLIAAIGGDVSRAEEWQRQSAGNPYFLLELSRAEGVAGSGLSELIRVRLDRLASITRQVLQAAAILEPNLDFVLLQHTSGRGEEEVLDALDELMGAGVLAEHHQQLKFVHPFVASLVRSDLSIARRSFLHRRAAQALESVYGPREIAIAGELAGHYAGAGNPQRASELAMMAARRAAGLAAPAEAVAWLRRAFNWLPTAEVQLELGQALTRGGALAEGREWLHRAIAAYESDGDACGVGRSRLAIGESYLLSGEGEMTKAWAENVLSEHIDRLSPDIHAYAHFLVAAGGLQSGSDLVEMEKHLAEAATIAALNQLHETATRSQFELGNVQAQRGDLAQALESYQRSIDLAHAAREPWFELLGHNNFAYHAMLLGDLKSARVHIEIALEMAQRQALLFPRQYLFSTRGEIALAEGDTDGAAHWLGLALAEAEQNANLVHAANVRARLGLLAWQRGDPAEALLLLESAQKVVAEKRAIHLLIQIELWLAELHISCGERAAATQALDRADALLNDGQRAGLAEHAKELRRQLQPV